MLCTGQPDIKLAKTFLLRDKKKREEKQCLRVQIIQFFMHAAPVKRKLDAKCKSLPGKPAFGRKKKVVCVCVCGEEGDGIRGWEQSSQQRWGKCSYA